MLTRFDHVTVRVPEVGAAVSAYTQLLGAAPSWRGGHPELGSEGALFALSNAVIELAGPRPGADEASGLRDLLASRGPGLHALAFETEDAASLSRALRAKGVRATPPEEGEAHGADGSVRRYRTVELSARATRGLAVLVVERGADGVRPATATAPPGASVDALDHVVIRTASPEAALSLFGASLGLRLALDRTFGDHRMLFFRLGGVTVEVVEDPTVGDTDLLAGLAYRVLDLDAARARLAGAGVEVTEAREGRKPGTRVFTVRSGTAGVPTLVLRDPTRDL